MYAQLAAISCAGLHLGGVFATHFHILTAPMTGWHPIGQQHFPPLMFGDKKSGMMSFFSPVSKKKMHLWGTTLIFFLSGWDSLWKKLSAAKVNLSVWSWNTLIHAISHFWGWILLYLLWSIKIQKKVWLKGCKPDKISRKKKRENKTKASNYFPKYKSE